MKTLVHLLRLLAMVVWVGGIVFFAFVLAPTVFSPALVERMHGVAVPGAIVGSALAKLDWMGMGCGLVFGVATMLVFRGAARAVRGRYEIEMLLCAVMLAATAYLQWNVIPAMENDRVSVGGDIAAAPAESPARQHFERLHVRSVRVESLVMLCGLAVVVLMGRELAGKDLTADPRI